MENLYKNLFFIIIILLHLCWWYHYFRKYNKLSSHLLEERLKFKEEKEKLLNQFRENKIEELNSFVSQQESYKASVQLANELEINSAKEALQSTLAEYEKYKSTKAAEISLIYTNQLNELTTSIENAKYELENLTRVIKESFESEQQLKFHMMNFTEEELQAITELNKVAADFPRIKNDILNVMYNNYYSGKIRELGKRLTNGTKICGIYKITNVKTQQSYIGQSVDIAARWVTHIKRAVGIETETQNKLYPAMRREGLENFSFQIVEETPKEKLRERELYWQEVFDARNYGYSVK